MPKSLQLARREADIVWTYSAEATLADDLGEWLPSKAVREEPSTTAAIVIIEKRALVRECLTRSLRSAFGHNVISFPDVKSWSEVADSLTASLIVLSIAGQPKDAETQRQVSELSQLAHRLPTILLSEMEDPDQIVAALDHGARGYLSTSVPLDVAIEAMRLVRAGGIFVPATSLIAARRSADARITPRESGNSLFTARQAAVVEALRRGKPNKIIAYELSMCESTVKVHVRNIMKKLKARNRTEVAFMTNGLVLSAEESSAL